MRQTGGNDDDDDDDKKGGRGEVEGNSNHPKSSRAAVTSRGLRVRTTTTTFTFPLISITTI
jgi:hypothetical protein